MKDNIFKGEEAKKKLMEGIHKISDAVGGTMGTAGSNAVLEALENPGHLMTNDGFTIASHIHLADHVEEMGRKILLEAISKANKESGDGSSTTCVLTSAIIDEGMKYFKNYPPMDIKRSLESQMKVVENEINKQKIEIVNGDTFDTEWIRHVATISSEDSDVGELVAKIYKEIGKDGIIHWDISKTTEDTYTIGKGITVEGAGYISPYLCDIDEKTGQFLNIAKWKNPYVLITKQKITSASEFNDLFQELFNREIKEIVVFCDEIEAPVIGELVKTRAIRGFKTMVIKMPVLWKDQWFDDLALASGATVIDPVVGISFKTMKMDHLGKFSHITVTKEDTFIDGIKDLTSHVKELEDLNTDDSRLRASRLNTKTARLFIGAQSDSALSYKRLKVEDAINAAWQALHGGIVPGGGLALLNVSRVMDHTVGGKILSVALQTPIKQIIVNSFGCKPEKVKIPKEIGGTIGFDSQRQCIVEMIEAGIVDPTAIVLNSVRNAVSVAASILTVNTIVTIPHQEEVSQRNFPVTI